jgi:hypothetical protein
VSEGLLEEVSSQTSAVWAESVVGALAQVFGRFNAADGAEDVERVGVNHRIMWREEGL